MLKSRTYLSPHPRKIDSSKVGLLKQFIAARASGNDQYSEEAAQRLSELPTDQLELAIAYFHDQLKDHDAEVRWWAVRALSEIPSPETPKLICSMLDDPSLDVKRCAALGMRLRSDPEYLPRLLSLLTDPDHLTSRLAGEAITAIGELAVQPLLDLMENLSIGARINAMRTLAKIADPKATQTLIKALDDPSMLIEYWANEGLERMGTGMIFFQP